MWVLVYHVLTLISLLYLHSKVGGLLASGLLSVGDFGTVTSWRKVFFIEGETLFFANKHVLMNQGIITTGFGLLCFIIIPTDPQRTRMFTPAERALALARIDADQAVRTNGRNESTTLRLVWRSFNINVCIVRHHLSARLIIFHRPWSARLHMSWSTSPSKDSVSSCPLWWLHVSNVLQFNTLR